MKTNQIKLTLAAALIAAAFNSPLLAAVPLHSPRGQAAQSRTASGETRDRIDRANPYKHRGDLVFHPTVEGVHNDRDLARERSTLPASPRALQMFPRLRAHGSAAR